MFDRLSKLFSLNSECTVWQDLPALKGADLKRTGLRYGAFSQRFSEKTGLPTEYVLPRIEVRYRNELPASMKKADERFALDPATARRLSQVHWGYYYYLGGGLSTVDATPGVRERSKAISLLRMQMINDVVEKIVGEEKGRLTLVDFACNWGGMAIDMALRGFARVAAFDFKEENIARATVLAAYMGANNVRFDVANVYKLPDRYHEGFDVVFNLGLLYHVTDPVKLAQITYELTRRIAVFDTIAHKEPFSGYIQGFVSDQGFKRPGMGEQQIELHPTYRGLIDIIHFAGFEDLVEVVPIIDAGYPAREKDTYYQGVRRTIIAFK
jgi:hypothetical protein